MEKQDTMKKNIRVSDLPNQDRIKHIEFDLKGNVTKVEYFPVTGYPVLKNVPTVYPPSAYDPTLWVKSYITYDGPHTVRATGCVTTAVGDGNTTGTTAWTRNETYT